MSKPTSATRSIPATLIGLVLGVCGCSTILGLTFFFFRYQQHTKVVPSIPQVQPPAPTQALEILQAQPPAPTQTLEIPLAQPPASTQTPEPIQYTPQYSDFLGKNQYDANFLNMSQIYCGFGQYDWVCPVLGIEFSDSQGDSIVDEVWIYPSGYANFEAYKGSLPYGLAWGDTYADVANKIGQPDAFLNYGWVYTNLGINIHYQTDAPSIPESSETIQYILIFLP